MADSRGWTYCRQVFARDEVDEVDGVKNAELVVYGRIADGLAREASQHASPAI